MARVPRRPVYRQGLFQVLWEKEEEGDARESKKEKRAMMAANWPVLLSPVILVIPVRLSSKLAGVHQVPGPVSKRLSVSPSLNHTSPSSTPSTSIHLLLSYHILLCRAGSTSMSPQYHILCFTNRWYSRTILSVATLMILSLEDEEMR
jgi:hypothetical protein